MPKEWYLMTRPLFNSGGEEDELLAFGIDGFNEVLSTIIAKDVLIYDKTIEKTPIVVRAIIQNTTSDTVNNTLIRQILCNIGVLHCGQYVQVDDAYWIVATLPDNNGIYEKAVLWKCKYIIHFRSPLTGDIVSYPIYNINSTQYGTGEANKKHISIGEAQHLVYVPYNEETIMLDDRFRFLIDRNRQNPTAYRIAQVDPISYAVGSETEDGIIQWSLIETPFDEKRDNKALMVADYYTEEIGEDDEQGITGDLVLLDMDGDQRLAVGEEKEIQVVFRDMTGAEMPVLEYIAVLEPDEGTAQIVSQKEDRIILYAERDRSLVGKKVVLHVICEELSLEARLAIQIVNW